MDKLTWYPRTDPLRPSGLMATESQCLSLQQRLLRLDDACMARLRGSFNETALVILGTESDLPWLPGGVYLGQDKNAPHLYIPTLLQPNIPIDWLDRAVLREFGEGRFVINPWRHEVYDLTGALVIARERLEQIL